MKKEYDVIIIGGGPAGLSGAIITSEFGASTLVVDENHEIGGQLIKQTHKFFGAEEHYCGIRGINIRKILYERAKELGAEIKLQTSCIGLYEGNIAALYSDEKVYKVKYKYAIVAPGARENMIIFENNDLPGIYGAGAVQTLVNVYGVKPGEKVLMIGSGNIGLIVSYQLMQAGIKVVAIIEALPTIGGYWVHAAKVRRLGIPILVEHTIKEAIGETHVEGAIIWQIKNWQGVPGTEKKIDCDVICLAAGLSPASELLEQAGCEMVYIPELGGRVAWHDENLRTSVKSIYVAGDVSGIEEAVTAMLEGKLAGAAIMYELTGNMRARKIMEETKTALEEFRQGHFGNKARIGKSKLKELNKHYIQQTTNIQNY